VKRRLLLLLSAAVVIAMAVVLPLAAGRLHAAQQFACFDNLLQQHAPLSRFSSRFGPPLYSYTYPSGKTRFAYQISALVEADVFIDGNQIEDGGKDIPDVRERDREILGDYGDAWQLVRHPSHLSSNCR
jgi:hypothetical protein